MHATIVLADTITLDPTQARSPGVLCVAGQVQALGDLETLRQHAPKADVLDLRDCSITPGLVDAHIHLVDYGFTLGQVNLEGCKNAEEAAHKTAAFAANIAAGEWLRGHGYEIGLFGAYPHASILDAALPNHAVLLRARDGHSVWLNSRALDLAGIHSDTPDPIGGKIVRDDNGNPTGVLLENAMQLGYRALPKNDHAAIKQAALRAIRDMQQRGFTAVHTMAYEPETYPRVLQELEAEGALPLRVWACLPHTVLAAAQQTGLRGGLGKRLRLGGIKFFADGALGAHTAWMHEAFVGSNETGMSVDSPDTILERGRMALELGFSPVVHAIGDRANSEVLQVFETLKPLAEQHKIRMRIEHAQHLRAQDIGLFAKLGVVAGVQPIHLVGDAHMVDALLGPARAANTHAHKALRDSGAVIALGSDAPVATPDPIAGWQAATQRLAASGNAWHPEQALDATATLEGYTRNAAMAAGWEKWYGQIKVGCAADFTVWDSDPLKNPAPKPTKALCL